MESIARSGEEQFDIAITFNGTWMHQGLPMTRMSLVKLFAKVLKRDAAGEYWLITPVEKGRIAVADAPFISVAWRAERQGFDDQRLFLTDNLEREVPVDQEHPLTLRIPRGSGGPFVPYHQLGSGVEARLNTSVYYDLVDLALAQGAPNKTGYLHINSFGSQHPLGQAA